MNAMNNLSDHLDLDSKKRKRTILTAKQHMTLNKFFKECAFPDLEQRINLGKTLNMTPRTVQIWFQNQRQKIRSSSDQSSHMNSDEDNTPKSSISPKEPRVQAKSLDALASAACIEYYKKFGSSDQKEKSKSP